MSYDYAGEHQVTVANTLSQRPQDVQENYRSRVCSHHLRELTLGKFVVKYENIQLLNSVGEGIAMNDVINVTTILK